MRIKKLKNDEIEKALKENNGYCPCRAIKNENTKCMCKEFREQIERQELGKCHCELYEITEE